MNERIYKAIFFDLDGTLLPMEFDEFIDGYFKHLHGHLISCGYSDPKTMIDALNGGIKAMFKPHGEQVNEMAFWSTFQSLCSVSKDVFEPEVNEFYTGSYNRIGEGLARFDAAIEALQLLKDKGIRLFLTTQPLFPRIAVQERLKWVGLDINSFEYVTTYENSCTMKPSLDYYRSVIGVAGVKPEDILMVGNNTLEDLVIRELGCDTWLVTDVLLDPEGGYPIEETKHGSFLEFLEFCKGL